MTRRTVLDNGVRLLSDEAPGMPSVTVGIWVENGSRDEDARENGIAHRLTQPASPTTTGKVERFHQTLRRELLNDVPVWPDIDTAQTAIDAFRQTFFTRVDAADFSLQLGELLHHFGDEVGLAELRCRGSASPA